MIKEESFIKAWENRRVVCGAIKDAGVRKDYQEYADLVQDGVLIYAGILEKSPDQDIDRLAFKKEKIEWNNLIILKNKVKKLNEIEKLVFFKHLLAQKEITNLVEVAGCSRQTFQRAKLGLLLKLKNALKN